MKPFVIKNPQFITSAVKQKDYPSLKDSSGQPIPEVAVAGRSNVGKSSLLNHLFQSKGLVKTSSTPGKTQMLNFFKAGESLAFVDLPGYGYAEVPLQVRKKWGPMVQNYLNYREALKIVLCLFDIRRIPNEEDIQMMEWAVKAQKSVILILTKVDKVNSNERKANIQKILNAFPFDNLQYLLYSTTKNIEQKGINNDVAGGFAGRDGNGFNSII